LFGAIFVVALLVHARQVLPSTAMQFLWGAPETRESQGKIGHLPNKSFGAFFGTKAALKMG